MVRPMATSGWENCDDSEGQSLPTKGTASTRRESGVVGCERRKEAERRPNETRDALPSTCGSSETSQSRVRLSSLKASSVSALRISASPTPPAAASGGALPAAGTRRVTYSARAAGGMAVMPILTSHATAQCERGGSIALSYQLRLSSTKCGVSCTSCDLLPAEMAARSASAAAMASVDGARPASAARPVRARKRPSSSWKGSCQRMPEPRLALFAKSSGSRPPSGQLSSDLSGWRSQSTSSSTSTPPPHSRNTRAQSRSCLVAESSSVAAARGTRSAVGRLLSRPTTPVGGGGGASAISRCSSRNLSRKDLTAAGGASTVPPSARARSSLATSCASTGAPRSKPKKKAARRSRAESGERSTEPAKWRSEAGTSSVTSRSPSARMSVRSGAITVVLPAPMSSWWQSERGGDCDTARTKVRRSRTCSPRSIIPEQNSSRSMRGSSVGGPPAASTSPAPALSAWQWRRWLRTTARDFAASASRSSASATAAAPLLLSPPPATSAERCAQSAASAASPSLASTASQPARHRLTCEVRLERSISSASEEASHAARASPTRRPSSAAPVVARSSRRSSGSVSVGVPPPRRNSAAAAGAREASPRSSRAGSGASASLSLLASASICGAAAATAAVSSLSCCARAARRATIAFSALAASPLPPPRAMAAMASSESARRRGSSAASFCSS
mmetsp:Transcript_49151/g.164094  ORF Transcript_49151/g.164094 Transcript_49151/m.164094 type:complete len:682 (-) Transcript_49151:244-2289(-)